MNASATQAPPRTVRDVMVFDVHTVSQDSSLTAAANLMRKYGIRHLVVTDRSGQPTGVFSERDLLRHMVQCLNQGRQPGQSPVKALMVHDPTTVKPDTPLEEAAGILATNKFGCLPVADAGMGLVGIISVVDLLQILADFPPAAD